MLALNEAVAPLSFYSEKFEFLESWKMRLIDLKLFNKDEAERKKLLVTKKKV